MSELPQSPSSIPRPPVLPERRAISDRRARPTSFFSAFRWGGRRQGFRRLNEGIRAYIDRPSRSTVILALTVVGLSIVDAFFTLLHLQGGGEEANPVMGLALRAGLPVFLAAKTIGTGLGIVFLAAHEKFKMSWYALRCVAVAYGALFVYHLALFLRHS